MANGCHEITTFFVHDNNLFNVWQYKALLQQSLSRMFTFFLKFLLAQPLFPNISENTYTGKNNGFPFLDILVYLKTTHKNPKFGKVTDKSQPGNSQPSSLIGTCLTLPNLGFLWVFFKYPKISKNGNQLFFPV